MKRWERAAQTMKLQEAAGLTGHEPGSQRHVAEPIGVPRSTLQYGPQRPGKLEAAPEVVAFLESPEGLALWHRWVVAAHVVITWLGSGGIRRVGGWLELTGWDRLVAASYGAQPRLSGLIEAATVDFGQQETARLAQGMRPQKISIGQDETFHPEPC